jgi:glycosyltransferase involved in cell wall biosynthesis
MKVLVWQWGRFGAGPRLGIEFAAALGTVHGVEPLLSLSDSAEILGAGAAARSELPVRTYKNLLGYATRVASLPRFVAALRRIGVPYAVVVHDADPHPGDGYPLQLTLQRRLVRRANALVILSAHVERRLQAQGLIGATPVIRSVLPQPAIAGLPPVRAHGGRFRLLSFGRLLAYKGLDLLAAALAELLPGAALEVRVVGSGPEGPELAALRALPGVTVENRWVPESEINTLLAWADGLVLSHREASQSGVAAAALAAGRYLVATRVGGLAEQAGGNPSAVLCDTEAHSLAAAIRTVLTLPPPAPLAGFGVREAQDLAAGLRGVALRARRAGGAELDGRAQGVVF